MYCWSSGAYHEGPCRARPQNHSKGLHRGRKGFQVVFCTAAPQLAWQLRPLHCSKSITDPSPLWSAQRPCAASCLVHCKDNRSRNLLMTMLLH